MFERIFTIRLIDFFFIGIQVYLGTLFRKPDKMDFQDAKITFQTD